MHSLTAIMHILLPARIFDVVLRYVFPDLYRSRSSIFSDCPVRAISKKIAFACLSEIFQIMSDIEMRTVTRRKVRKLRR